MLQRTKKTSLQGELPGNLKKRWHHQLVCRRRKLLFASLIGHKIFPVLWFLYSKSLALSIQAACGELRGMRWGGTGWRGWSPHSEAQRCGQRIADYYRGLHSLQQNAKFLTCKRISKTLYNRALEATCVSSARSGPRRELLRDWSSHTAREKYPQELWYERIKYFKTASHGRILYSELQSFLYLPRSGKQNCTYLKNKNLFFVLG